MPAVSPTTVPTPARLSHGNRCLSPTAPFSLNSADSYGGVAAQWQDAADIQITVDNCDFSGNTAGIYGGAFHFANGQLDISNSSFTGSTAGTYGVLTTYSGGTTTISDCTITGNSASNGSGFALIQDSSASSITMSNSTACDNGSNQIIGTLTDGGGNCISEACDVDNDGVLDCEDDYLDGPNPGVPGSLQIAVDLAANGDVITLSSGTYRALPVPLQSSIRRARRSRSSANWGPMAFPRA